MIFDDKVRSLFWKLGFDVIRFSPKCHPLARRKQLLKSYEIDLVLDVGANIGKYGKQLRNDFGYSHQIVSFEPLSSAFKLLKKNALNDSAWEVYKYAIGDIEEKREINIAGNSDSSSFLAMLPSHIKSAPTTKYIGKEFVEVRKLDSLFENITGSAKNIYLKIDTQGFEHKVLQGAEKSLDRIATVQMEMSLVPLYDGELLFNDMCMHMNEKGYTLVAIEPGFSDRASGQLLQADGIFHRF